MGTLSHLTKTALNIIQGTDSDVADKPVYTTIAQENPLLYSKSGFSEVLKVPAPKSIDFFRETSTYFVSIYQRASYYFYNCSILNTVIRKIVDESLRNGLEFVPRFQSKCPRCGTEYETTTKECKVCHYNGVMKTPDYSQKELLVNWRGQDLMKEVNRNGWSLQDLTASLLIQTLVYNQPLILCKSLYVVDEHGNALDEIPQEFIPIAPTKARYQYDERGEPGKGTGFKLRDRTTVFDMNTPNPLESGFHEGQRLYPARWCVSEADGGWESGATYYANEEIFHKVYSVPSMTYGTPICTLIEFDIRAWIAMEMRIEKYYNTGHPQGIFVVSGITPSQLATIQQSIREQMIDDPYQMPMMGIPPGGGDTVKTAKWFQLADNPTGDMMQVKAELQQRVSGAFGVSGLFLGDVHSIKGNSNETQQMAVMDRNLTGIRNFANTFLDWVTCKYKGLTDWVIRIVEPADEQTRKQAEDLNKELINAQLAQEIGFPIIGLTDNKIEIGSNPINIPQLNDIVGGKSSNAPAAGVSLNDQESHLFGVDVGDSADVGRNMMRAVSSRGLDKEKADSNVITAEKLGRVMASLIKSGVDII